MTIPHILIAFCLLFHASLIAEAQPGFISIDCGGDDSPYTDAAGINWVSDRGYVFDGSVASLNSSDSRTFQSLRYFGNSNRKKNCYNIGPVNVSSRYLVRASFLYGDYDGANAYPSFGLSVDSSPWATVTIINASTVYFEEFIGVATNTSFIICLYRGTTGNPFISTLELRPLIAGMYSVSYLEQAFLKKTARINFGALSGESIRFPDDPTDRIWLSDLVYPIQGKAPGTQTISTDQDIVVDRDSAPDRPPVKVMQTAVVGTEGTLSYRLNLKDYPAESYAIIYFAEIQELQPGATRAFYFHVNFYEDQFKQTVLNLARDRGTFTAFGTGYKNITLPTLFTFELLRDNSSTLGPLMNAMEIYQIMPIIVGTFSDDVTALSSLLLQLSPEEVVGDPCLPQPWDFLTCSSDSPPRVSSIDLSARNLSGSIPEAIGRMTGLVRVWLDNNQLTGSIPDLSQLTKLQELHLQNNALTGQFPASLGGISTLTEIFVENNRLTGTVPARLLKNGGVLIRADGNPGLCARISCASSSKSDINLGGLIGGIVGGALVIAAGLLAFFLWRKWKAKKKTPRESSRLPFHSRHSAVSLGFGTSEENPVQPGDGARLFKLAELVDATDNFSKEIGSGGFGPVYYGKLKDGEEIAVKVLADSSNQGAREFFNEVNLLSRVHHRNLVVLFGYYMSSQTTQDPKERMLVYEYMHKGTLRDHLYGPLSKDEPLDWLRRLNVALDSAKGLEYLHTGCNPSIIHRDVKSSNILINRKLSAKVADFGLSKLTSDSVSSTISTAVRGTVGYVDPEYYVSQQLTLKSDVFSFGVVLLELISGREPIIAAQRDDPNSNIVNWARGLLQKGDLQGMVDPELDSNYRMESVWRLAELALSSVEPHGKSRPTMSQIVIDLTEIIRMETPNTVRSPSLADSQPTWSSTRSPSLVPSFGYDLSSSEIPPSGRLDNSLDVPTVR